MRVLFFITILLLGCKSEDTKSDITAIAQVGDKVFSREDLVQYLPQGASTQDSQNMVNSVVEKWIRQQIWDIEAERNVPSDLNINELVAEYRSNLLRLQYEEKIIQENIDTTIPESELEENYELLKLEYLLKEPILKCWVAKINKNVSGQKQFYTAWREDDALAVDRFCEKNAEFYVLDDQTWITLSDFHNFVPNFIADETFVKKKGTSTRKVYDNYYYYIKIKGFVDESETPPLEYIKDNLKKVIYQKRKKNLLENYTEKLYHEYTSKNKIQVFSN